MSTEATEPTTPSSLDIRRIFELLPHRYPFLLVDRVLDYQPKKRLRAIKNVSFNEAFFQGHFPGAPVMPGVLIIEALAQACGLLVHLSHEQNPAVRPLYYLVKIDKARFSKIVSPGDQLLLDVEMKRVVMKMGQFHVRALVDGAEVASAELMCAERAP